MNEGLFTVETRKRRRNSGMSETGCSFPFVLEGTFGGSGYHGLFKRRVVPSQTDFNTNYSNNMNNYGNINDVSAQMRALAKSPRNGTSAFRGKPQPGHEKDQSGFSLRLVWIKLGNSCRSLVRARHLCSRRFWRHNHSKTLCCDTIGML